MAFVAKAALWRANSTSPPSIGDVVNSGRLLWLPQPILSMPVGTEWKGRLTETRLADGAEGVRGNLRSSRVVSITGQLAKTTFGGTVTYTEQEMFELFENLQSFVNSGDKQMELFVYYDLATTTYRKYKKVYAKSLMTDIGDNDWHVFPWTMQLILADPVLYTTAPGA